MDNAIFLLVKDPNNPCRDIIRQRDGDLRILVFCLNEEDFDANPDELQFYANNNGTFLAFETSNYDGEDPVSIIEAIRWYADYIENPRMEILAEDPRLNYRITKSS
jgi:hypothetical protein